MSNSSLSSGWVRANSTNYTRGRSAVISRITYHHMAGRLTAKQCGDIFARAGRGGSAHYGIGYNGEIMQYVDEGDTAWSDGNWSSNQRTVSIETSNSALGGEWPVSDASLKSLIKLIADIAKRNNLGKLTLGKNLFYHSMLSATQCPGNYLRGKAQYIIDEANKIISASPAPKPAPKPAPAPAKDKFFPAKGYWGYGDTDARVGKIASFMYKTFPAYTKKAALGNWFGPNLKKAVTEFQRRTKLEADGNVGPKTLAKLRQYGFKG